MAEPTAPGKRRSLLLKLLALSAIVSLLSITATAWLAVRTTTRALQKEQSQALTDDARIYDALLGYAATHHDWTQAGPLVSRLAHETGHRIALTDQARTPIADSATGKALPDHASATVDPLNINDNQAAPDSRIDPRAVGPFQLTAAERSYLQAIATRVINCLRQPPSQSHQRVLARTAETVDEPSGRPRIVTPGTDLATDTACRRGRSELAALTQTESRALNQLGDLVNACLKRRHLPAVTVGLENTWTWVDPTPPRSASDNTTVSDCLAASRREQLAPYTAPAAMLYVTTPGSPTPTGFDLSPTNRARIAAVTSLVLLAAIGVTALVGVRLVRPLRALTTAAGRMRDGDGTARVAVTGRDEIARLAAAFNDMAERRHQIEQLRQAMVHDIAHEMRSPVTNIRGWLEAAGEGVVPLDRDLMASLLDEALLLHHVIDDLQDLAAADAGELRLHPEQIDLADLLPMVAEAFAASADRARVALAVHAPPAVVHADPIRLRQALGNLLSNAIRHTPAGGQVTVTSHTEGDAQLIDVADTGPGLSADEQTLVFERFWRAEKSRSRMTGGSGLGLSIVRKLAEAHGGSVTVRSKPGEGATFTLRLPR
ncbi:HAMP domain-containing histidine kinase [Actinoplanes sp. KI2]|uniref:sensor histidine kinase n=1 Tax=Actinoplanes sp. KI2 TaxID=2983315 RepID=UPI0021D56B69|nr:HAMP domain-containing sensor histidine kinase [Actinoplanes sp. KI2]MCU7729363.1 HAMP domain-containing histidine kinase [Actinoplanes sp. KI2]